MGGVCTNCTKFCIDDYSYLWGSKKGIEGQGDYWHSAPFPADFHFNKHIQRPFPWEMTDRPFTVSYVGSTNSYSTLAAKLKTTLVHFCGLHKESRACVHNTYGASTKQGNRGIDYNDTHFPHLAYRYNICVKFSVVYNSC